MINRQNQRSSSNNSVSGVPRRTNFMNQPHMLAYINPEEERLLRGLGGTGQPGPGGIPAYPPSTQSGPGANVGPSNSGTRGSSNNDAKERRQEAARQAANLARLQAQAAAAEQMMADQAAQQAAVQQASLDAAFDDYTPTAAELNAQLGAAGQTNLTDAQYAQPVDYSVTGSGQDYTTAAQADTDVSGFEYGFNPGSGTLGSNEIAQPFQTGPAPRVDEYGGTSVGGDMFKDYRGFGGDNFTGYDLTGGGNTVGYSLGQNGVGGGTVTISPDGSFNVVSLDNSTTTPYGTLDEAMAAIQGNPVSQGVDYSTAGSYNTDSAETSALLSELGYGSDGSGLGSGATPQAITDLALGNGVPTEEEINTFRGAEAAYGGGQPVIDGGVDAEALKANLRAKMLSDINARKREVEGTDDDGGFDRILGGQEDNFGVKPTEMTVQEVLDFQNQRGEGSYAAYSQDVNAKRGFFRDDGSPRISTPVGVNQVVGLNLQQMVDDGIIDPNDLYNEDTQNTISEYLIADKRGLDDYLDGNITLAQLEKNLGNEFEGIAIEGLYGDDQPTTAVASLAPDISLRPVPRQLASAETTGETSGEILARLAAQRESDRDTSGDVQVAAMDSRGPLSDTITSNLNLDEIDSNIINASVTGRDDLPLGPFSSREGMDDYFGVGKESISGLDLLESEIAKDSGRTIEDDREYLLSPSQDSALDYYTTGAGATGSGVNPFDSYTKEQAKDFRESPGNVDMSGLDSFSDGLADVEINSVVPLTNEDRLAALRGLSTKNTGREDLANLLTPDDGAVYINGQLVDEVTGESMTGGGYSSSKPDDYVYGVSDYVDNNTPIDTSNMTEREAIVAKANQKMLQDIPPDDLSYFASFIPGMVVPIFGGAIGDKMLSGGIESRRAIIDAEIKALEGGATPNYDKDGNYIGHTTPSQLQEQSRSYDPEVINYKGSYVTAMDDLKGTPVKDPEQEQRDRRDERLADELNICEEGFAFDPKEGICMPIASSGGEDTQPVIKPRPVRPDNPTPPIDNMPIKPEVEGVKVRKVKQFAQGGSVTPNIDNFLANLGS